MFAQVLLRVSGIRSLGWLVRRNRPLDRAAEDVVFTRPFVWERHYPDGLDWSFEIEPKPLWTILDEAAVRFAARPCLEFLGRRSSYREIAQLVARAAKGFQGLGVRPGVRVGLCLPNCPYYVISYFAILKAGGTVVNFNPLYAEREIARQIDDSGTRIIVTLNIRGLYPKIRRRLEDTGLETIVVGSMGGILPWRQRALFAVLRRSEIAEVARDEHHVRWKQLIRNDGKLAPVAIDPLGDTAVLQYTGGTTGLPKAARLSHAALLSNTRQVALWFKDARPGEEKVVGVLPLFHVFGMTAVMNVGVASGFEIILMPRFRLDELLKLIHRAHPTVMLGVPTMYSAINDSRLLDQYDLSSLRYCISGGAPLPLSVQTTFERLTGCALVEGYGLSEAGPVCTINPIGGLRKPGSIGLPLPGTIVEITAIDQPDRRLPIGQRGEICITGPQVMSGYLDRDDESAEALRGGRLHTGDVGYIDEDGFVHLIDRIKDLILNGGFNVYPRMVEEALELHPEVIEASVCGVPDPHRGEIVKAFVRRRSGALSALELRAFLKDKLAPFEIPRRIEFRDELPTTLMGKPDRRALIAQEMRRLNDGLRNGAPASPSPARPAIERGIMSLESVTQKILLRLDELAPLDARVKFVVDPAGIVLLDARQHPPVLSHEDAEADTTIRMDENRFEQLIDGRLSPTLAYTLGQIKVEGSLGVAMKLASLLDT